MKLTILGTGTFFVDKDHSGPAYFLEADDKKILIDCGPGTLIQLSKIGVKPEDLDYIFITHFHGDHITDLVALLFGPVLYSKLSGKELNKYPQVYGPEGLSSVIKKISDIFTDGGLLRNKKIKYREINKKIRLNKLIIVPFKVKHTKNSLSYRFELSNKALVLSGDSGVCTNLEKAIREVDLFIADTSHSKKSSSDNHLNTYQIGDIAARNNVKSVILTHIYPDCYEKDLVSEVKEKYSGKVVRGKDLMQIKI